MNNSISPRVTAWHLADLESRDSGAIESTIKHCMDPRAGYTPLVPRLIIISVIRYWKIGYNIKVLIMWYPCSRTGITLHYNGGQKVLLSKMGSIMVKLYIHYSRLCFGLLLAPSYFDEIPRFVFIQPGKI